MGDVKAMRSDFINPEIFVHSLQEDLPDLDQLYVVGIDKNGDTKIWATGDLKQMSFAAMVFQDMCMRYLRGEVE